MSFLTKADLTSDIYTEDIDAITEGNDGDVTVAINRAIGEAKGYLDIYDVDTLFATTDDARDPILVGCCVALAMFWLTKKCAANQNIKLIRDDAVTARAWFARVQSGKQKQKDWPLIATPENATYFHVASNCKRGNHY